MNGANRWSTSQRVILEYESYKHRCVRDLAWVIASPALMSVPDSDVAWPRGEWYRAEWRKAHHWLLELDRNPLPLVTYCRGFCGNNYRLGRYFEALMAFWFEHDSRYELLHHDLQMHIAGRTVGAFDFILRDCEAGLTLHIEVAIKFYLGTGADEWPGPNRQDSLQRKVGHLVEAQSRLSMHSSVRTTLQAMDIHIDERIVMLKGRLFYPADATQPPPLHACVGHLQGRWWQQAAFSQQFSCDSLSWVSLEKTDWLSVVTRNDKKIAITFSQLKQSWDERPLSQPYCLAAIDVAGNETFRVFVVPDGWND